jgi:hypothetical protein
MRPVVQTQSVVFNVSTCPITPLDHYKNPFNTTIAVVLTGTANARVQFTVDDPYAVALNGELSAQNAQLVWFDHATLSAVTANATGNVAFPVRATRTVVSTLSSGNVVTTILQAGGAGN